MIRVCLAGGTGWAGSAVARAISTLEDMIVVSAVSRTHAGKTLGDVLGDPNLTCFVYATVEEALAAQTCDVFFEFTKPDVAKQNVLSALAHGAHVVVGTSGLTDADYDEIRVSAEKHQRGVLAVGNFALTVVLLQKFSEIAAKFIPQWEIIDYASDAKKRFAERNRARAGVSPISDSGIGINCSSGRYTRRERNSRRAHDGIASSFHSPAWVYDFRRSDFRYARPEIIDQTRFGFQRPALCGRLFAGDS